MKRRKTSVNNLKINKLFFLCLHKKMITFALMNQRTILILLPFFVICAFLWACGEGKHAKMEAGRGDSLLFALGEKKNYTGMINLADSLEVTGDISEQNANRWRGTAYFFLGQMRASEYYYKKVVAAPLLTAYDRLNFNKAARRLSTILMRKGDYEGALRLAVKAEQLAKEDAGGTVTDRAVLLTTIGCCQLNLGMNEKASENFNRAYQMYNRIVQEDTVGRLFYHAFTGTSDVADVYLKLRNYIQANQWLDHADEMLRRYESLPASDSALVEKYQARLDLKRAVAKQGMGLSFEAAKSYKKGLGSEFAHSLEGHIAINDYLMAARRYHEAADNLRSLDQLLANNGVSLSLDNIQHYLLPKFRANVGANRRDSAIMVGMKLCDALENAILLAKSGDAIELATIYDTQQKEAEIAQQKNNLTKQRFIGTIIALLLIVVFFTIYILFRRKAQRRLSEAHAKLQNAYNQLEETTAAKERIESELRIARDIQMSMLPQSFPHQPGLDLYAAMMPAKEVGGDLYCYLQQGELLYFCIGDVSGKGVPASLFMAQATRLFRSLASQHMMPAEIATHMNAALTENNEQGMFVTMFIGLVDLPTGHLDFCNAGHNPPIVIDEERTCRFIEVLPNAPIGLWPGLNFDGETMTSIKHKLLFVYSDGLTEAENLRQEQFGEEHLLHLLGQHHALTSRQIIEMLKGEVDKHRNGAAPNDDLTMLCLELTGE